MGMRNEDVHQIATGSGEVRSAAGERIGDIGQVYLDNESNEPNWVTVKTGLFGTQESFVPLAQAEVSGADVVVPYDKDTVKNAPRLDAGGSLVPEDERRLYSYYFSAGTVQAEVDPDRRDDDERRDAPVGGDRADDDQVDTGGGGSRLRRYVVTEKVVPVSREEVPVDDDPDRR